nr:hypothetical protein [Desulfobacterales bacterium]
MHPRQTMNARTRPLITPYAGPPPQLAYDPYQMGEPPLGADLWIPPISLERETEGLTGPAKNGNDLSDHKIYDIDISHIRSTQRRKELTESMIRDAYTRAKGNITRAAKLLGIHRATLYRHMKSLGLKREDLDHSSAGIN